MVDATQKSPRRPTQNRDSDTSNGSLSSKNAHDEKSHQTTTTLMTSSPSLGSRLDNFLFKEISIAPLVYYRIIFGGIMFWEVCRYLSKDWIPYFYIDNEVYFKYFGWHWMPGPLPGNLMYLFYLAMAVIYVFFALGLWYRFVSIAAFLGFFYWFNLVSIIF
jgi:hypothetical protein